MHIPRWVRPDAPRSLALECCLRDNDPTHLLHTGVIMPDHVHLIFTPVDSENHKMYSWAEIMGGIKRWRRRSLSVANWVVRGRVWQKESFDRVLRSSEDPDAKLAYIPEIPFGVVWFPNARARCGHGGVRSIPMPWPSRLAALGGTAEAAVST